VESAEVEGTSTRNQREVAMNDERRTELRDNAREAISGPIRALAEGRPVAHADVLAAARRLAGVLQELGMDQVVRTAGPGAGVWKLEDLTDDELVALALRFGAEARALGTSQGFIPQAENPAASPEFLRKG
jgi:hypothetical protein